MLCSDKFQSSPALGCGFSLGFLVGLGTLRLWNVATANRALEPAGPYQPLDRMAEACCRKLRDFVKQFCEDSCAVVVRKTLKSSRNPSSFNSTLHERCKAFPGASCSLAFEHVAALLSPISEQPNRPDFNFFKVAGRADPSILGLHLVNDPSTPSSLYARVGLGLQPS